MKTPKIVEVLEGARLLVERGWCQNRDAKTRDGKAADSLSDLAAEFCASAACHRAASELKHPKLAVEARRAVKKALGVDSLVAWNDAKARKQADVVAAFDAAIWEQEDR